MLPVDCTDAKSRQEKKRRDDLISFELTEKFFRDKELKQLIVNCDRLHSKTCDSLHNKTCD